MKPSDQVYTLSLEVSLKGGFDTVIAETGERTENGTIEDIGSILALDALDERFVMDARQMAQVYVLIAAFENSVRG